MAADEQLALLASITCMDIDLCRVMLARAGGDLNLAAQHMTSEGVRSRCAECGKEGDGYYGQGSYSTTFFCGSCWSHWGHGQEDMFVDQLEEQENMLQRDLGLLKAETLEDLGAMLAKRISKNWNTSLNRTAEYFAWNAATRDSWESMATRSADGVERWKSHGMETAWRFLSGAAKEVGSRLWKLLTIYEIQVASQLPRRQNREASRAVGCTGVACASSSLLGQTEEVDVYIYDYGKLDIIVRLASQLSEMPALLYDPASTMCPIGIGASGLCVSRFTLYPRNETEIETRVGRWSAPKAGLPLTAILWELFLGSRNLPEAVEFLKGLFSESSPALPLTGAAMLLMQPGYGAVMIEWSPKKISVSPAGEGVLVHANHCILDLRDAEYPKIAKLLEDSKRRQAAVESQYAEELLAGKAPPLSIQQIQSFLSLADVQNDDVLATVISCPRQRALYVRFRLQIRGMERVEDTIECDFWQCFES